MKELIKDINFFFSKTRNFINENKNWVYFIIMLTYLMIFAGLHDKNQISDKIYSYSIDTIISLYIILNLLFNKNKTEKFLIKNITPVIFIPTLILFFSQVRLGLTNNELFIIIGGVFGFWYGYKKYERDKELEILKYYGEKYDKLKELKDESIKYKKILNLCEEEYYLYKKGYITKKLWERIEFKIEKNLGLILRGVNDQIHKLNSEGTTNYLSFFSDEDILSFKKGFGIYIIGKLEELRKDYQCIGNKNINKGYYNRKEIIHEGLELENICRILIENIKEIHEVKRNIFQINFVRKGQKTTKK